MKTAGSRPAPIANPDIPVPVKDDLSRSYLDEIFFPVWVETSCSLRSGLIDLSDSFSCHRLPESLSVVRRYPLGLNLTLYFASSGGSATCRNRQCSMFGSDDVVTVAGFYAAKKRVPRGNALSIGDTCRGSPSVFFYLKR